MKMNDLHTTTPILKELKKQQKESRVDFDPNNAQHRRDFVALEQGKLPVGKYNLMSKYYHKQYMHSDVLTMMKTELSLHFCELIDNFQSQVKELSDEIKNL